MPFRFAGTSHTTTVSYYKIATSQNIKLLQCAWYKSFRKKKRIHASCPILMCSSALLCVELNFQADVCKWASSTRIDGFECAVTKSRLRVKNEIVTAKLEHFSGHKSSDCSKRVPINFSLNVYLDIYC